MSPSKELEAHPLFRGAISRWLWRIVTQRLTRAGRWFLLPTAAFTVYAGASLQLQGHVVLSYVTAIWIGALAASIFVRPRVRLRAMHAERVCAGETLPVDVEVEQLDVERLRI